MRLNPHDQLVLDALAEVEPVLIARTIDWCAVNSGSRNAGGLARQRALLEPELVALPGRLAHAPLAPSREVNDDGSLAETRYVDALLLTVRPEAPVQAVLTGHYDTVYPKESPFQAVRRREDGALWGPGVADMKGGISIMLAALSAFERHPEKDKVGYRVLLSPDEEIGSPGSAPLLETLGREGHVGLTYEPALADGTLAGARKGSGNFHILVRGRSAHAGRDFESGRNAVAGAAEIALKLHGLNGQREGVTVNVARISGGSPVNVVPDVAVVRLNVRVPSQTAAEWVRVEIEKIAIAEGLTGPKGLEVALHGGFTRPPKPLDEAQLALLDGVRAAAGLIGQEISWRDSGGVCEGNNLHAAGLPNVDTLGVRGGDIHSEAEYALPESFLERAQLSAMILMKLASGEIDARRLKALRRAA
jgi:glutamate carboxypeptidase